VKKNLRPRPKGSSDLKAELPKRQTKKDTVCTLARTGQNSAIWEKSDVGERATSFLDGTAAPQEVSPQKRFI